MTTHQPPRPATLLRRALVALLREPRAPGSPDVWLAGLRLGG
ncbi:hypothetical protein ACIRPX_00910 [Streptomyces sp. NPDC101225]